MFEISSLKTKKISDLHKIAKEIGFNNYKDLKKTDLIYKIIDFTAEKIKNVDKEKINKNDKKTNSQKKSHDISKSNSSKFNLNQNTKPNKKKYWKKP